ncbi:MAG: hypothetical protein CMO82_07980 [Winogradskyella sp.]|nr:hypothetical protein [Winogradskyella sp.]|tara:strand:- start:8219 stop:11302 length:3084 start_codon:yes stop_codon:yes gene_type:complete
MRRLLLFLLLTLTSQFTYPQDPSNDTVATATELTDLNYVETNIRLDLADVNTGTPVGCNTNGFSGVYYKFTATENNYVNAFIQSNSTITNSFVIAYTANNLNATSMSELTHLPESACAFGIQTSFTITSGQSYYIMVHRSDANALTDFTFSEVPDVPQSERDALIAFYNATGGDSWTNNTNWNTDAPVNTWFGVFTTTTDLNGLPYSDGLPHVWGVNFFENNNVTGTLPVELGNLTKLRNLIIRDGSLTGNIPEELYDLPDMLQIQLFNHGLTGNISPSIQNLTNLQVLDIRGNNFSGTLPDLSILPNLNWLDISNNNFIFSDFENQFTTYQNNLSTFQFIPQANVTDNIIEIINTGENLILDTGLTSANNQYTWFFNGAQLVDETGPSVTLDNIQAEQMGTYFCQITNSVVSGLALFTGEFVVGQDPTLSPDYNILVDLYNNTGGDNWTNNTNWLNPSIPLSGWHGITVDGNSVLRIALFNNNLQGSLPSSITNLSSATSLSFGNNNLSGLIPDFSAISTLEVLGLNNNDFSFLDFEPNFTNNSAISSFIFSPQNPLDNEIILDAIIGDDYTFNMTSIAGSNVEYQWHTLSTFDQSVTAVSGQNTNQLNLNNIQANQLDAYTCIATSPLVPGLEVRRNMIELKGPVSQIERDALIAFYNATNGQNWTNAENWNTAAPVSTWQGVTTTGNKVTRLALQSFNPNGDFPDDIGDLTNLEALYIGLADLNLTGNIPETIGNLTNLKVLWFQATGMSGEIPESFGNLINLREIRFLANSFTGTLPASMSNLTQLESVLMTGNEFFGNGSSFSGPIPFNAPNATINLQENNFDFGDLEPFVTNGNYLSFNYSPQNTDDVEEMITSGVGSDVTISVNDGDLNRTGEAMNNQYQWFKDNVAITGANASSYTITNAQTSDNGIYYCEITNPVLPDLTLIRADITITIDSSLSIDETEQLKLSIYPNPVQNWLHISTHQLQDGQLFIYDLQGKLVITKSVSGETNVLNLETLPSANYIVKIIDQKLGILTQQFTKQ